MADRLGIVTRYAQLEITHAAIHLAEMACERGTPATIFGVGQVRREVAKSWDSRVITMKQQHLARWAQRCNRVIWTHVPQKSEVLHVQSLGVETALLIDWETLIPDDQSIVLSFDKVLIPYRCVAHVLQRRWALKKVTLIMMPWDVPVPLTRREGGPHKILCAYFPMYDSQPQRLDQAVFSMMHKVLADTAANVMIACGRRWSLSSKRIVKQLRKDFGPRVVLILRPNILQRLMLFARTDLTVWAPRFESFGLIGLNSLYMGAPVISWNMRPQNEFLVSWKNAILVPARTTENWLGVPEVKSGYREFGEMLVSALHDKALIAKMKNHTSLGLDSRRKQFEAGWSELHR